MVCACNVFVSFEIKPTLAMFISLGPKYAFVPKEL